MGDGNLMDEELMDLDLNEEPLDPVVRLGSFLNELQTPRDSIEERIRQLEAVTARTRQRRRWRQARNSAEISLFSGEQTDERERGCKRDSSHLVAKALAMDSEIKKVHKDNGSFFDCNICLDMAREPVLTCCGHLFCWACFYQVSYTYLTYKECPVCKGEVSDNTITPIYGNGNDSVLELDLHIPPRPKAHRVESIRQQQITRGGVSLIPVAEALRRIRISIGEIGDLTRDLGGVGNLSVQSTDNDHNSETETASLSNVGQIVEDIETLLDDQLLFVDGRNLGLGSLDSTDSRGGGINMVLPTPSASRMGDIPVDVVDTLSTMMDSRIRMPASASPSSAFLRRRRITSRISDLDDRDSRESRRRRLT